MDVLAERLPFRKDWGRQMAGLGILSQVTRRRKAGGLLTLPVDRGKTVTDASKLSCLGLLLSEKQIPQVVENLESGDKSREALETVTLRVKQAP